MIRQLYVDNFRSLVDFTWEPGSETLVLGYNGSGKTSVFDALEAIRNLMLGGDNSAKSFNSTDRCRFLKQSAIRLGLDMSNGEESFKYEATLGFTKERGELVFRKESLVAKGGASFAREYEELKHQESPLRQITDVALPRSQSAVSLLQANRQTSFVHRFAKALESVINVRPMPPLARRDAEHPEDGPSRSFENFVAWYWNCSSNGSYQRAMLGILENIWPEFDHLKMERLGREAWGLEAVFKNAERSTGELSLDFDELSDGERMLVMLYALVGYQKSQPATTIVIDEPDNFVSLLELQPWLRTLLDTRPDDGQIILVSHNPEIIQTMGEDKVAWFSREDHLSPTRVSSIPPDDSGLSLSERLARGWIVA